jgi:hypothetical protein
MAVTNTLAYHTATLITYVKNFYSLGTCTVKLFTYVIVAISKSARVFATAIHFHPSLIFASKAGLTRVVPLIGLHSNGMLLVFLANIR